MRLIANLLMPLMVFPAMALGFSACDDDDPVDPGNGNGNGNDSVVVILTGDVAGNRTLDPDSIYVIEGFLEVRPGATLTVPAGTQLISDIDTNGSIVTLRGDGTGASGRLVVQGTAGNPVVFRPGTAETAELGLVPAQVESCSRGDAGGIVLHGNAPINVLGGTAISEGVSRPFGGDDPADDSGSIEFLVILCGGTQIAPDNEVNGLTFAGTGSGTVISHVQAHLIADDGFEWFGGTTHADHLISSGNDDDGLDCDFGWNGTVQFAIVVQDRDLANRGVECDNDGDGSANTPITTPTFWNVTWIGAGVEQANSEINDGPFLRRNSAPSIRNGIVANFGNVGIVIDGSGSQAQAGAGELDLDNILFFENQALASAANQAATECLTQNVSFRTGDYLTDGVDAAFGDGIFVCGDPLFASVNFNDPIDGSTPDLRPQAGSPALDPASASTPSGPGVVDPSATYLGAFDDGADWTAGWSVWVDTN
jgi:hypothetical protein